MSNYAAAIQRSASDTAGEAAAPLAKLKYKLLGFLNKLPEYFDDVDPSALRRLPPPY